MMPLRDGVIELAGRAGLAWADFGLSHPVVSECCDAQCTIRKAGCQPGKKKKQEGSESFLLLNLPTRR